MHGSTLTTKGQTTLPRDVWSDLGPKLGDKLRDLVLDDGEVRLLKSRPLSEVAGVLAYNGPPASLEELDEVIAQGAWADIANDRD